MSSPDANHIKKRKRQRPIVSCAECHRRKQKCDRQQPCRNCTLRSASHLCQYGNKPARQPSRRASPTDTSGTTDVSGPFGYVRNRGCTAAEVLEKLDLEDVAYGIALMDHPEQVELHTYNRIITTVPPRPYTLLLVQVFFTECNWIYGSIHQGTFCRLLDEWYESCTSNNPPCPSHAKHGHGEKRRILSQFPTLLLQVLGVALQMLPREHYKQMSQLNILGKEDFRLLSAKYSNAACELAALLAPHHATLPRVQHWFLRASWLKSEGRAVESWHALGQSIREAQELGLHKEQPRSYSEGLEGLTSLWQREMDKRVWVNLYVWDRFMGMILGRPTLINDRHCTATPPVDCNIPADFTRGPPVPRGPLDPPSGFTERLLDYELAHVINEVDELQFESGKAMTHDFVGVERLHRKVRSLMECFPPSLAVHNRDTSHDVSIPFLRAQAELLKCSACSLIVGLHRPFVFSRQKSQIEIVKAGIVVLESQEQLFEATRDHHHTIYTLNFFTFDPAVLIAAVLITSPLSLDQDLLDTAMVYLQAGCRRMEILGTRVKLAEKGAAVLKCLVRKAQSSIAAVQQIRVGRSMPSPPPSESTTSSPRYSTGSMSHDSPTSPVSMVSEDPMNPNWIPGTHVLNSCPTTEFSALGPINTGILSTRELDEILAGPPDLMVGTELDNPPIQFETGMLDNVDENFWQSLLYVPFP